MELAFLSGAENGFTGYQSTGFFWPAVHLERAGRFMQIFSPDYQTDTKIMEGRIFGLSLFFFFLSMQR
jgi:hypothetical protein